MQKLVELGKYYNPYQGGIENNTEHCAKTLSNIFETYVVVFNETNKTIVERVDGIPVIRMSSLGNVKSQEISTQIYNTIKKIDPDVIHLHAPNPLATIACFPFLNKKKIIVTHHADIVDKGFVGSLFKTIYRQFLKQVDGVIAYTSSYAASSDEINEFMDKTSIVPHGTNVDHLLKNKLKKTSERKGFSVGFIGRHVEYKGIRILLEATAKTNDINLQIAGEGEITDGLKSYSDELSLGHRCNFLGNVRGKQKAKFFNEIDVLVLPSLSRAESYGQVLVEAQLLGVPVIASRINSGVIEIVKNKETGLLVEPGDPEELKKAMLELKEDSYLRSKLIHQAKSRAQKKFSSRSVEAMLKSYFSTYLKQPQSQGIRYTG